MEIDFLRIAVIFAGGLIAGIINVMVGGASMITIPILNFAGLPMSSAIGTNRFCIIFQSFSGAVGYYKKGKIKSTPTLQFAVLASLGSAIGARIVVSIDESILQTVVAVLMIGLVFLFLIDKQKGLESRRGKLSGSKRWIAYVVCFFLGIYGGFIGIGVTTFIVGVLVVFFGYSFIESAATVQPILFSLSVLASAVFWWKGKIVIEAAVPQALGMFIGAYLGAHSAVKMGNLWVKRIFATMVFVIVLKLLGVWSVVMDLVQKSGLF